MAGVISPFQGTFASASGSTLGTGTDGPVILDGATTFPGFSSLVANVYTLTRDLYSSALTINPGITLKPANFRIFCTGTVTNNGTITQAGNNAAGSTAGPQVAGSASFAAGRAGGAGGTGVSGAGAAGSNVTWGTAGGAGGAGTSGAAGAGGTATVSAAITWALQLPFAALAGVLAVNGNVDTFQTGPGGGGGGSDVTSNAGGGGGGGGGIVAISALALVNNGTITVAGGNGAAGTAGNAGGGGGGSGGAILVYTVTGVTGSGTTNITGGSLGAGSGTGAAGTAGGTGLLITSVT